MLFSVAISSTVRAPTTGLTTHAMTPNTTEPSTTAGDVKSNGSDNTLLYVIIGVLAAIVVTCLITISAVMITKNRQRQQRQPSRGNAADAYITPSPQTGAEQANTAYAGLDHTSQMGEYMEIPDVAPTDEHASSESAAETVANIATDVTNINERRLCENTMT